VSFFGGRRYNVEGRLLTCWLIGFHATTSTEFAEGFEKALSLANPCAVRLRARKSAKRFTEEEFAKRWTAQMEALVGMRRGAGAGKRRS